MQVLLLSPIGRAFQDILGGGAHPAAPILERRVAMIVIMVARHDATTRSTNQNPNGQRRACIDGSGDFRT
jgi:hypothetical protein